MAAMGDLKRKLYFTYIGNYNVHRSTGVACEWPRETAEISEIHCFFTLVLFSNLSGNAAARILGTGRRCVCM